MAEVLSLPMQSDGPSFLSSSPLKRSSPGQSFPINTSSVYHRPPPRRPTPRATGGRIHSRSSIASAPSSPVEAPSNSYFFPSDSVDDALDDILLPSYNNSENQDFECPLNLEEDLLHEEISHSRSPTPKPSRRSSPDLPKTAEDDTAVGPQPIQHVDYLSHNWKDDELWASWRHVQCKRKTISNRERLENASWRSWAIQKNRLPTVKPETLNWQKEADVTWLYGPLQPSSNVHSTPSSALSGPPLSKENSFLRKKPILKKRSMSEMMLRKSQSTSSLLKDATACVHAQQSQVDPPTQLSRASSEYASSTPLTSSSGSGGETTSNTSKSSSGLHTPRSERRHIHFCRNVSQFISIEALEANRSGQPGQPTTFLKSPIDDDESEDDDENGSDDGIMMRGSSKQRSSSESDSDSCASTTSKDARTIVELEPTTLKDEDEDEVDPMGFGNASKASTGYLSGGGWGSHLLCHSSSEETLRPPTPGAGCGNDFLLGDEDAEDVFDSAMGSTDVRTNFHLGEDESASGLKRTESGMLLPMDDSDEEDAQKAREGILGTAAKYVNTARDISHVIWNVGWNY